MNAAAIHPRARAAQLCHSPKVAARETGLTQAEIRAIRELKSERYRIKQLRDPLLDKKASRAWRTKSAVAKREAEAAERNQRCAAERAREEAKLQRAREIRETLLLAARVARGMGFDVRASKSRDGKISSYYVSKSRGPTVRISDHEIPSTPIREAHAFARGEFSYNGYAGAEIIIDCKRRALWLKRALVLTAAGRIIPC